MPSPAGWERLPAAYLGFGEAYAAEQARARAAGWPVSVLPGRHLHPLVQPAEVADAITGLHAKATAGDLISAPEIQGVSCARASHLTGLILG